GWVARARRAPGPRPAPRRPRPPAPPRAAQRTAATLSLPPLPHAEEAQQRLDVRPVGRDADDVHVAAAQHAIAFRPSRRAPGRNRLAHPRAPGVEHVARAGLRLLQLPQPYARPAP